MARLYDRAMVALEQPGYWTGRRYELEQSMPVIVADNVSDYFYEASPQNEWDFGDFPNLAPPFELFWMEAATPSRINRNGKIERAHREVDRVGWEIEAVPLEEGGWEIGAAMFMQAPGGRCIGPSARAVYRVTPEGGGYRKRLHANDADDGSLIILVPDADRLDPEFVNNITRSAAHAWQPMMLALSFMHCKNVEKREIQQPPKLSKKWEKKHGRPLVRYHVLDIDPMRKVLRDEGGSEETGLKRALHICRGHFAHYPEGLFGRGVPETVWRPQHIRGSKKEGLVLKDYNVKAPTREKP